MKNQIKTEEQIAALRESGRMLAVVNNLLIKNAIEGVSGTDLDHIARVELKKLGGTAPFLGYGGFPGVVCISVNDAVIHGIPNSLGFKNGDVVGFDFGVKYKGMVTDSARTVVIGGPAHAKLRTLEWLEMTRRALDAGIDQALPGKRTGDIGAAVDAVIRKAKFGSVQQFCGHGVGHELHEEPEIPNYGQTGQGQLLRVGMTIAIEPMLIEGGADGIYIDADGWTVRSSDHSLTAHEEDTILIAEDGPEILTRL